MMSVRDKYPAARLPRTHYFLSLSRGEDVRAIALKPLALWAFIAVAPLLAMWAGAATLYVAFHDDMLGAVVAREARMQNAYEERLAQARAEVDRVASRQLLDQNSFEGKMHDLLSRQARLEQRGAIVAALAAQAGARETLASAEPRARVATRPLSALTAIEAVSHAPADDSVSGPARAYAPLTNPGPPRPAFLEKPHPVDPAKPDLGALDRPETDRFAANLVAAANDPALDAPARLGLITYSLDRVERGQIAALGQVKRAARETADRLGSVIARVGLTASDLKAPADAKGGVGGPFIPLEAGKDASAFEKAAIDADRDVETVGRLRGVLPYLPLRMPLTGEASVSSPFGYRPDPFLGRPALHPGIDLVQAYGADIRATAAGRVSHAGPMGGYGNAVEIDHGNNLATRYGHMSEVLVEEGQFVKAGDVIGRIGSTGRSTGPHLHYEVRIDGEPVDPDRFLRASQDMAGL